MHNNKIILKEIKNQVSKIIQERVDLITEKWSISSDVETYSEDLVQHIKCDLSHSVKENIGYHIWLYTNQTTFAVLDKPINLVYFVYNCPSRELVDFVYNNCAYQNGYNEKDNTLSITLYMVNNQMVDDFSEQVIYHELEHVIQSIYGYRKNPNYKELVSKAYHYASEIINGNEPSGEIGKKIAWLFYYSDSHEQDAFMQEYARILRKNPSVLISQKSEIHKILEKYQSLKDFYIENKTQPSVLNALSTYKIYGYNQNNFETMVVKQFSRFKRKMNNIEKNFKNNNKLI